MTPPWSSGSRRHADWRWDARQHQGRLAGATALATHLADTGALAPGLPAERARDLIWLHTAPDIYRLLVRERGWTLDQYERWFAASLAAALLPGDAPAGD